MSDDFDDDLPLEEEEQQEEDDFDNFDPERYLRRRRTLDRSRDEESDLDRDLPLPRGRRSYPELAQRDAERSYGRARGGGRYSEREDDPAENITRVGPGFWASILALFTGENLGLFKHIIPELGPRLGPLARWIFGAIGCIFVLLCGLACVGAYFIYTLVNHR